MRVSRHQISVLLFAGRNAEAKTSAMMHPITGLYVVVRAQRSSEGRNRIVSYAIENFRTFEKNCERAGADYPLQKIWFSLGGWSQPRHPPV